MVAQLDRRREDTVIDEAGVRAKFGVSPGSIPDYLALVGDSADGFPGLPGWGAKSAAAVLTRYEHLDAIPDDARSWDVEVRGAAKLASTLATARDAAMLFLDLATLRTNGDVGVVDDWEWRGPEPELAEVGRAPRRGARSSAVRTAWPRRGGNGDGDTSSWRWGTTRSPRAPTGRRTASSCCSCTGSRRRRTNGASNSRSLAAAGYRAVAPDQRGYASGARPENVDAYKIGELASDAVGFADALGVDRFHLVGHDWGGAVAWFVGGHYGDRLRSLTVVSTPHPTPFAKSIAEGEQREKSAYMLMFRDPSAEDQFLANDGEALRGLYEGAGLHDADAVDEYVRVFTRPLRAHRWPQLVPRQRLPRRDRTDHRSHDVRVVHRRHRARSGSGRGDGSVLRKARTASRSSRTSATGCPKRRPTSSTRSLLSHLSGK